jgi:uncharacterized protein DUF3631
MSPAVLRSLEQRALASDDIDPIDAALSKLQNDPGALFEPNIMDALRDIRRSDPARFARVRARAKASKAVSLSELDRLTAPAGTSCDGGLFEDVEPWSDPVNGAALLDEISAMLRRYVIADAPTLHAAALWIVQTWLIDHLTVSPIANITAPEMRCGKTVLLTVLGKLAYRAMQVANIAPAAIFRAIEAWSPTLLVDEVDTFLQEHEEARGILNSGFTRDSAFVMRCVGDDHMPAKYSTWGAKALCGIGKIANTLADRSIPLRLRRKTADERVENLRRSNPEDWDYLRARIARFAADNGARIAALWPTQVDALGDRANDCWEPLFAIADFAGSHWPETARAAALTLHGIEPDVPSTGAALLGDVREVFEVKHVDRLPSADLLTALVEEEEAPWATWNRGRPMSVKQLSARLADFGIRSQSIRLPNGKTPKGFHLAQFGDAFSRYLCQPSHVSSATSPQANGDAGLSSFPIRHTTPAVADREIPETASQRHCGDVAVGSPLLGEGEPQVFEL